MNSGNVQGDCACVKGAKVVRNTPLKSEFQVRRTWTTQSYDLNMAELLIHTE